MIIPLYLSELCITDTLYEFNRSKYKHIQVSSLSFALIKVG